jgi:long-chain acyl-CoA synthetase
MEEKQALLDRTLWTEVADVARRHGNNTALTYDGRNASYSELMVRVEYIASSLRARHLARGDRIALVAANGPWFFDLLLACARDGYVLVPINDRLTSEEVAFIMQDARPRIVVCDSLQMQKVASGLQAIGADIAVLDVVADLAEAMVADGVGAAAAGSARGTDVLLQMYTSGTTGKPKGAMLSNLNVLAVAKDALVQLGKFRSDDVILLCLPLFHIAGTDFAVFSLLAGAKAVVLATPDPVAVIEAIDRHGVTKTLLVPAVIRSLVARLEQSPQEVSSLRTICFGAAPMPEELIERLRAVSQAELIHVYGLTEAAGMFTYLPFEEIASGRRRLSCGKAFRSGEIRIVDSQGVSVGPGVPGEVLYRGPQAMTGYWQRPHESGDALSDGWLHTGDIGYLDREGFLFIHDRLKDMIKSGGENVYPAEVENVLLQFPGVADAAVIGIPDDRWGEATLAVLVPKPGSHLDIGQIDTLAREKLAGFKVPKGYVQQDALPRNAAGKVLKHELRKSFRPAG